MSNDTNYESKAITTQINEYSVYAHKSPNNKLYFGITSLPVKHRWYSDGSGYKNQKLFYRAIQKYGWDNFEHFVLATNLTKEQACKMEQDLIAMFQSNNAKFGYNNTSGGDGIHDYTHTVKAKRKISKAAKRNKSYLNLINNSCDRRKKCALIDTKGTIVYSFNSLSECANYLGMSVSGVSVAIKHNRKFGYLKFVEVQ